MTNETDYEKILKLLSDTNSLSFLIFAVLLMGIVFLMMICIFILKRKSVFLNRRDNLFSKYGIIIRVKDDLNYWIISCFKWTSYEIYSKLGLDTLVLIVCVRLFLIASIIISLLSLGIILPIHIVLGSSNHQPFIIRASIASIGSNSNILIVHFVLVYITSFIICLLVYSAFYEIIKYRQQYFADNPLSITSLLLYDYGEIPCEPTWEDYIKRCLDSIISSTETCLVYVLRNYKIISHKIKEHDKFIDLQLLNQLNDDNEMKKNLIENNAITKQYESLKNLFNTANNDPLCACIVIVSSVGIAQTFRCTAISINGKSTCVSLLPERNGIIWRNLAIHKNIRKFNGAIIYFITGIAVIFWAFQFAFVSAITKSFSITDRNIINITNNKIYYLLKFLTNTFIPLILIQMILYAEHLFFKKLSTYENHISYTNSDFSILIKMCIFNGIDTILIYIVSSSLIELFIILLDHPLEITRILASSIPLQSNFFMIYLSFHTLILAPWYLLKGSYFLHHLLCKNILFCKRSIIFISSIIYPTSSDYIYKYSSIILIFGIGLLFSLVSPLICIVWFPYFIIIHIIFCYDEERNNLNIYKYNGEFWPIISNCIIIYLIFYQLIMIGIFTFRNYIILSLLLVPCLFLTIYFLLYIKRSFQKYFKYPTLQTMQQINTISPNTMNEYLEQYKLHSFIPPIDKKYSDILWDNIAKREIQIHANNSN